MCVSVKTPLLRRITNKYFQALFSAAVFQDFDRTKLTELRGNFKPLHIFLGVFLVFSAVIAIETGIVEKAMFREKSGLVAGHNCYLK